LNPSPDRDFPHAPRVLFTDLDRTLLDLQTYRPSAPAVAALRALAANRVAAVAVNSKTAAEIGPLLGAAVAGYGIPAGVTRLEAVGPAAFVEAVRRLGLCWRLQVPGMTAGGRGLPDSEAVHV
jgi:hypothetical protein